MAPAGCSKSETTGLQSQRMEDPMLQNVQVKSSSQVVKNGDGHKRLPKPAPNATEAALLAHALLHGRLTAQQACRLAGASTAYLSIVSRMSAEERERLARGEISLAALQHAMAAGDALIQAQTGLRHGQWLPWLKRHCSDISERTARNYMTIAAARGTVLAAKSATVADLSIRAALGLIRQAKGSPRSSRPRSQSWSQQSRKGPAPAVSRHDVIGWWSSAPVVDRQRFIDSIGRRALAVAIPAHWNMRLAATEADLGDIDKVKPVQTEARLAPDSDDLDIPPCLHRAPIAPVPEIMDRQSVSGASNG